MTLFSLFSRRTFNPETGARIDDRHLRLVPDGIWRRRGGWKRRKTPYVHTATGNRSRRNKKREREREREKEDDQRWDGNQEYIFPQVPVEKCLLTSLLRREATSNVPASSPFLFIPPSLSYDIDYRAVSFIAHTFPSRCCCCCCCSSGPVRPSQKRYINWHSSFPAPFPLLLFCSVGSQPPKRMRLSIMLRLTRLGAADWLTEKASAQHPPCSPVFLNQHSTHGFRVICVATNPVPRDRISLA